MKRLSIILIVLIMGVSGCSSKSTEMKSTDVISGYLFIIDQLFAQAHNDIENNDMKYLAVDTTQMIEMNEADKAQLLSRLSEKYGYELLDKTYEQLVRENLIVNNVFSNGALIQIKNITLKASTITADASIYFAALGGHGFNRVQIEFSNGQWQIQKTGETWVA
ncbi:MAG: hypothetical protein PHC86_05370 [Eubacteriales bacterium]|nr:hypothetical protein [Eubacteriales bacterium]